MTDITRRDIAKISAAAAIAASSSRPANAAADSIEHKSSGGANMGIERYFIQQADSGAAYTNVTPIISLVTAHENIVYVCGVTADPARGGDIKAQTKEVLDRIDRLLSRAGTDKSKILSAQVWLTDMAQFADHNAAWNTWADAKNPPARACLHSPQLWHPGLLVEIMVTAAK